MCACCIAAAIARESALHDDGFIYTAPRRRWMDDDVDVDADGDEDDDEGEDDERDADAGLEEERENDEREFILMSIYTS